MVLKLLAAVLTLLLVAESFFIFVHYHPANRFKPVDGYGGLVAFDTSTGLLCKTLRTKTAAEIDLETKAEALKEGEDIGKNPASDGSLRDRALAELDALAKASGPQVSKANTDAEFIAALPVCKDIR